MLARNQACGLFILLGTTACFPSFDLANCYVPSDCPGLQACVQNQCVDEMLDVGFPDTGPTEPLDAEVEIGDAGVMDFDAGPVDIGPADVGAPDIGLPDAAPPDTGERLDAGIDNDAGPPPVVTLSPNPIDFGIARIGCRNPMRQAVLHNEGPGPTTVQVFEPTPNTSGEFQVDNPPSFPVSVPEDGTLSFDLRYNPNDVNADFGGFRVVHGPRQTEVTTSVRADGVLVNNNRDTLIQSAGPIDILFVVDNSSEADWLQAELDNQLFQLFLELTFQGWDYQIGVTTTDVSATGVQGALIGNPAIITAAIFDPQTETGNRIMVGSTGSDDEQGFEAARRALSEPMLSGPNAGFLREEAALLIIFISDEDDNSPMTVASYANFYESLKGPGNDHLVSTSVIVSTEFFCSVPGGNAAQADRYLDLPDRTGGAISNICNTPWENAMTTFPPIDLNQSFRLDGIPNIGTIQVFVDNAEVASGNGTVWSYDPATQSVIFQPGEAPDLGLQVEIQYNFACN